MSGFTIVKLEIPNKKCVVLDRTLHKKPWTKLSEFVIKKTNCLLCYGFFSLKYNDVVWVLSGISYVVNACKATTTTLSVREFQNCRIAVQQLEMSELVHSAPLRWGNENGITAAKIFVGFTLARTLFFHISMYFNIRLWNGAIYSYNFYHVTYTT